VRQLRISKCLSDCAGQAGEFRIWPIVIFIITLGLGCIATSLPIEAQQPARIPRVGYLGNSSPTLERDLVGAFRQGLRDLGYAEGENILIEYRWAKGQAERFPKLAAELVRLQVDVLLTAGTPEALAAKQASHTIPIVMATSGDPVETGLIASLARPGGTLTGLSSDSSEVDGKRLELLKGILPRLSRVAVLINPANPITAVHRKQAQAAAEALHLKLEFVEVKAAEGFEAAFAAIPRQRPGALFVMPDRVLVVHRARIVDFAARRNLPAIY
jgi:putative ABC transport system substrate-binding protein